MNRIPLNIVVTATGATTPGVLTAVMVADLDALEAKSAALLEAAKLYVQADENGDPWPAPAVSLREAINGYCTSNIQEAP